MRRNRPLSMPGPMCLTGRTGAWRAAAPLRYWRALPQVISPTGVRWPVFLHVPTTSRASWAHALSACPACLLVMRLRGRLIISDAGAPPTQARRACRAWPACGCRPASAPPRKARSVIRRPRRAAPERITGHYAVDICQSALRSGAFSAGRLFQARNSRPGPGNGLVMARRKMAGRPCCGQQARDGRASCRAQQARGSAPAPADPEPGRDRAARLVAGTWRRASAYRLGAQRRQPANSHVQAAQRDGPALAAAVAWTVPWRPAAGPGSSGGAGGAGAALAVSASLIANPRYGPSGINVRLRSRNAVSVTRNEFRRPLRIRRPGGRLLVGWPPGRHYP